MRIHLCGMSPDAEFYMYVDSGIEAVGAVQWGAHFCQFYETADDLIDTLVQSSRPDWTTTNVACG